ncbi:hypothetical protein Golax_022781 [Gossypium laxum]|uniref:RNase H type-1 domain-containing protein n=1 Tax=Gossypium laxum TaxID=34288 RepID=A0A7J9B3J2_9ROSI|nr:hypothetical protein [Gossypium laxum]
MHRLDRGHHACFGYESGCRLHYNAWNSWNNHNKFVFKGKEEDVRVVWDRAITLCQDFRIHNLVNKPLLPVTSATKNWVKPPLGFVKINFDAAVSNNKIGYWVIARDSDGFVLGGWRLQRC